MVCFLKNLTAIVCLPVYVKRDQAGKISKKMTWLRCLGNLNIQCHLLLAMGLNIHPKICQGGLITLRGETVGRERRNKGKRKRNSVFA